MNKSIGVECSFDKDGRVQVRRIEVDGSWQTVEQGRQWLDENGRHVLIMMPGGHVQEIILTSGALSWELVPDRAKSNIA